MKKKYFLSAVLLCLAHTLILNAQNVHQNTGKISVGALFIHYCKFFMLLGYLTILNHVAHPLTQCTFLHPGRGSDITISLPVVHTQSLIIRFKLHCEDYEKKGNCALQAICLVDFDKIYSGHGVLF